MHGAHCAGSGAATYRGRQTQAIWCALCSTLRRIGRNSRTFPTQLSSYWMVVMSIGIQQQCVALRAHSCMGGVRALRAHSCMGGVRCFTRTLVYVWGACFTRTLVYVWGACETSTHACGSAVRATAHAPHVRVQWGLPGNTVGIPMLEETVPAVGDAQLLQVAQEGQRTCCTHGLGLGRVVLTFWGQERRALPCEGHHDRR